MIFTLRALALMMPAKRNESQSGGLYLYQREVGGGVGADELGGELTAVVEGDDDTLGVLHHVVVGENVAVVGDDDSRTEGAIHLFLNALRYQQSEKRLVHGGELFHLGFYMHHPVDGGGGHVGEIGEGEAWRLVGFGGSALPVGRLCVTSLCYQAQACKQ